MTAVASLRGAYGRCRAMESCGRLRSTARTHPSTASHSPWKTGKRPPVSHSAHRPRLRVSPSNQREEESDPLKGQGKIAIVASLRRRDHNQRNR
jgi:hypothetical protein